MKLRSRKLLDRSLTGISVIAIVLMALALLVLLGPIFSRGSAAFFFRATSEFRRFNLEQFNRGDNRRIAAESQAVTEARRPLYKMFSAFAAELEDMDPARRRELRPQFKELRDLLRELLGPLPGELDAVMLRQQYGQTRWDRAQVTLQRILFNERLGLLRSRPHGQEGAGAASPGVRRHATGTAFSLTCEQNLEAHAAAALHVLLALSD